MHGELGAGKVGDMRCDLGRCRSGCGNHRIDRPADGCTGSELRRPAHDRRLTDEFEDPEGEVGQGSVDRCAEPGCGEVALKDLGRGDRNEGAVEIEERSGGGGHAQSVCQFRTIHERAGTWGTNDRRFGTFLKRFRGMYIGYDEKQEALRKELRDYYNELLTPEIRDALAAEEGTGPVHREIVGKMGRDGWLTVGWPEEYGGRGYSAVEQFVMFDESVAIGAPIPMLTVNTVGPTLMQYGTQEQKDFFLPKISRGEITFCVGYSEPDAGTDLASLQCRAVRDGDEFVINGQKTWTSLARDADYIWLAARTNPDVKKHKGISLFCIPMDTPGLSIEPLHLLSSHNINHTFFDDVRVPASTLIGEENGGWGLITSQLNRERVTICSSGMVTKALEETVEFAKSTQLADGTTLIDKPWVQRNLAEVTAELEFLRLMNWKVAWEVATHIDGKELDELDFEHMKAFIADSSSVKVFGTEFFHRSYRKLMEIYGPQATIAKGSIGHLTRLEMQYRSTIILTFGGGTNEMQRDLISQFGLGYPKADR